MFIDKSVGWIREPLPGTEEVKEVWHVADVPKNDKFQYTHFAHKIGFRLTSPSWFFFFSSFLLACLSSLLSFFFYRKDTLRIGFCINIINESFLEERQRAENRTRETKNQKFTPRWFDLTDEITSTPWGDIGIYQYNGKYTDTEIQQRARAVPPMKWTSSIEFNPWQYGNVSTESGNVS
ncbi:BnaA10g12440D [Brassica napus]|uniref:(rape) hypothetical protein n=1 Tax=Brassica napus TaxID=3708 RepID=A0A078H872_BRANA|nr:unnamed protein product [Brassica napus]CDY33038.1 BnaA10g12440D [Brassica napus]